MTKDKDFLIAFFNDCRNEMRWRSEVEHKLLAAMGALYTITATLFIGINKWIGNSILILIFSALPIILLIVFTYLMTKKIISEHKVYSNIGRNVVKIWKYFRLFDKDAYIKNEAILDKSLVNFGQGRGYKDTINILWMMTLIFVVLALIFSFIVVIK